MPTLEVRGVELAWSERGDGPLVLLVHETAATGAVWGSVVDAIGGRARAITYDRRGWGSSSAPDGYRRTTVEEQSEDAAALIESLDSAPSVACGAGAGAVIALDLMLRRPGLLAGAVLIEPPVLQLLPAATEALSEDRRRLETAAAEGRDPVELYLSGELTALGPGARWIPDELAEGAKARPESLIAELGMATGWRMQLPRLARAERPSLILTGTSTPPLVREASAALADRLSDSRTRELSSDEASPHLGAPAEVAAMTLELAAR